MVTIPTVHRNGTSKDVLIEGYKAARHAVRKAMDAHQAAAPNARDYYVQQDPRAFTKASEEHVARSVALRKVYDELTELMMGVDEQ